MIHPLALPLPLAAILSDRPGLTDALQYQIVGMAVVFSALSALWLVVSLVGLGFVLGRKTAPRAGAKTPEPAPAPDGFAAPASPAIDPEILAVLTAAIHETVGAGYRVASLREIPRASTEDNIKLLAWSAEGRRQIFSSHRIR